MAEYLINYDMHIDSEEARAFFIEKALNRLFTYVWQRPSDGILFRLPDSKFFSERDRAELVIQEFNSALEETKERHGELYLRKLVIVTAESFDIVLSDRSKAPEHALQLGRRLLTCMRHQHVDPYFRYGTG